MVAAFSALSGPGMSLFPTIPARLTHFLHRHLHKALPPVPDETAEEREDRQFAFMSAVARLAPMNTAEALLAVHAVAAEAHALDALHALHQALGDPTRERQYRAQSCSMTRQGMQARRELLRMQQVRCEAEAWQQAEMEAAADRTAPTDDAPTDDPPLDDARLADAPLDDAPAEAVPAAVAPTAGSSRKAGQTIRIRSFETDSARIGPTPASTPPLMARSAADAPLVSRRIDRVASGPAFSDAA